VTSCLLSQKWLSFWKSHDAAAIRAIQDALTCCGFRSTSDMAWYVNMLRRIYSRDVFVSFLFIARQAISGRALLCYDVLCYAMFLPW
jgi:hypothetical protein